MTMLCSDYEDCRSCTTLEVCYWCSTDNICYNGPLHPDFDVNNNPIESCQYGADFTTPARCTTDRYTYHQIGFWPLIASICAFAVFLTIFLYCCCSLLCSPNKKKAKVSPAAAGANKGNNPSTTEPRSRYQLVGVNPTQQTSVVIPVYVQGPPVRAQQRPPPPLSPQLVAVTQNGQVLALHHPPNGTVLQPATATYAQSNAAVQSPVLQAAAAPTTYVQSPVFQPATLVQSPIMGPVAAVQSPPVLHPKSPIINSSAEAGASSPRADTNAQLLAADLEEERRRNRELRDRVEWLSKLVRTDKE